MTAGEDQPEPVILDRSGRRVRSVVGEHVGGAVLVAAARLAPESIDRFAGRSRGEPGTGVGRNAFARPPLDRGQVCLGGRVLGEVEITEPTRETGHHPRPLLAVGTGDGLLDRGFGHSPAGDCRSMISEMSEGNRCTSCGQSSATATRPAQ
jgi:hypothetical protein